MVHVSLCEMITGQAAQLICHASLHYHADAENTMLLNLG